MFVDFNILNQLGSPSINSNTFANRPAAGQTGRLFVSTDTFEIYRDNGTTWDLIGGPGSSTITGTGTATQVAYFTSSQAIGSSSNLYWDNTNIRLGIGTSTPGVRLDIHGTGNMLHINSTSATANSLMAFQRTGTNVWRLGDQYNGGSNFFELHNTTLASNAIQIDAATNKSIFTSVQNYVSGLARANYFDYTLNLPNGTTISSPNAVTTLGSTLNLNIAGSATLPNGARSGMDVFNGVNFTSAGTFTINQASTIRAFSNLTSGWAFNGSAVGTITHLAGMRVLFPTNSGTSINVTTNYGLLINDQTANTGTITYTNRWGIYQEGASDLNYMAANLLLGSTVNTGDKLQVTGTATISSSITANSIIKSGGTSSQYLMADGSTSTLTNPVTGTGTTNYIPKFTSSSAIGNSNLINDAAGNLGLGQAPNSTWIANSKAIQIKDWTSLSQRTDGAAVFGMNIVETSSNSYSYLQSFSAGRYQINGNEHTWYTAPSGTAGNAISFTQAMTLFSTGNLAVGGTSDNGSRLNVTGAATFSSSVTATQLIATNQSNPNLYLSSNAGGTAVNFRITSNESSQQLNQVVESNHPLTFWTNATERMRITSAGNVGIGTNNPGNRLHVYSTSSEVLKLESSNATGGNYIQLKNSSGDLGYWGYGSALSDQMTIYQSKNADLVIYTNGTDRMYIKNGGNILIGTSTDAGQKLQVNGSSKFSGNLNIVAAGDHLTLTRTSFSTWDFGVGTLGGINGIHIQTGGFSALSLAETTGNATFSGSIKTGNPNTGTAAAWKLGSVVAAAVALDATKYIEVEVGGVFYKLAIVV